MPMGQGAAPRKLRAKCRLTFSEPSAGSPSQGQVQACFLSHLEINLPQPLPRVQAIPLPPWTKPVSHGLPLPPPPLQHSHMLVYDLDGPNLCPALNCIGDKKNDSCTWPSRTMKPVLCPPASWPAFACLCRSCPYLRAQHSSENPSGPPLRSNWDPHSPTLRPTWGRDKTGFLGPGGDQKGQWGRNPEPSPEDQDPSQQGASGERDPGVPSLAFVCVSIWKRDLGGSAPSSGPGPR